MKKDFLSSFLGLIISATFFFNNGAASVLANLAKVVGIRGLTIWSYSIAVFLVAVFFFGLLEYLLPKFKKLHFISYSIGFLFSCAIFLILNFIGSSFGIDF